MGDDRVSFEHPPVAEVALAAYFSPPLTLRSPHIGLLWERWSEQFPRFEDHPALPAVIPETFTPSALQIQVIAAPAGIRTWFLSDQGDRLIQIQADRIVCNWRQVIPGGEYPRYDTLRPDFAATLADVVEFAASQGLGDVRIGQAEVSYTNPIALTALGESAEPARLIAPWSGVHSDGFLPEPEDLRLGARYLIPDPATGAPAGRLYVQANPAVHVSPSTQGVEQVYMLQLFARGAPLGAGPTGTMAFLDLAHTWVVNGFKSFTTPEMHAAWGLQGETA